jgi:cytoskeletal protein CcmA (bactofilin family)
MRPVGFAGLPMSVVDDANAHSFEVRSIAVGQSVDNLFNVFPVSDQAHRRLARQAGFPQGVAMFDKPQNHSPRSTQTAVRNDLNASTALSAKAAANPGAQLVVGPTITLKGAEIVDCDTLIVDGLVEANIDSRAIRVSKTGSFTGHASVDVAEIWGRFDGELMARSLLIVHANGKVTGNIRYARIRIEEGGELSGDVCSLAREAVDDEQQSLSEVNVLPPTAKLVKAALAG